MEDFLFASFLLYCVGVGVVMVNVWIDYVYHDQNLLRALLKTLTVFVWPLCLCPRVWRYFTGGRFAKELREVFPKRKQTTEARKHSPNWIYADPKDEYKPHQWIN